MSDLLGALAAGVAVINCYISIKKGENILESLMELGIRLVEVQEDSLKKTSQLLKQELQNEALRAARTRLEAIETLLNEYLKSGDGNRLQILTIDSAYLLSELKSLGLVAGQSFYLASSIRILILREQFYLTKALGEIDNIRACVNYSHAHLISLLQMCDRWNEERYTPVTPYEDKLFLGDNIIDTVLYTFYLKGNSQKLVFPQGTVDEYWNFTDPQYVENLRTQRILQEQESSRQQILGNYKEALNKLLEIPSVFKNDPAFIEAIEKGMKEKITNLKHSEDNKTAFLLMRSTSGINLYNKS